MAFYLREATATVIDRQRRLALRCGVGAFAAIAGAAAGALTLPGCAARTSGGSQRTQGRVVVIGGGFGGATAAKYLRLWSDGSIEVVLVERELSFISCPVSNLVLAGTRSMADITLTYAGLLSYGVKVRHEEVAQIDVQKRLVRFRSGIEALGYDRLIVAPGVDLTGEEIEGFARAAQERVLHAWVAGPQTVALRRELEAMRDGGVYVMTIPRTPLRCPAAPYERVCQVAWYFKRAKPRSKIIVLDANEDVASMPLLFKAAWNGLYGGMIEYQSSSEVVGVDAATRSVRTDFDSVSGDVLNVIPAIRAAGIARATGLITANERWCDVDWLSMESTAQPNVHVLGDATLAASAMPKSAHMANQHGKLAAAAIIALMQGRSPAPATINNTCYSFVSDGQAMHQASVHRYDVERKTIVPIAGAGGMSAEPSESEAGYAHAWATNIWRDTLS